MTVTGLVKINRVKDCGDTIKGILDFIAERTQTVEQIGFVVKKTDKIFKGLSKFQVDGELVEVTGKLFRENKNYFISVLEFKLGKTKYDLFNNNGNDLGIKL